MIVYKEVTNYKELFKLHLKIKTPYISKVNYEEYLTSLLNDVDSYGNKLFKELYLIGAYSDDKLIGFIQFGRTNIGFDKSGEISKKIHYSVIRNLYFKKQEVGENLIKYALAILDKKVYAFFHYFGMSCFARHGKLFEKQIKIDNLLKKYGFVANEENVYYSLRLLEAKDNEVVLEIGDKNKFNIQDITFKEKKEFVGQCEIHFAKKELVYLRWIYVVEDKQHLGFGSKCMIKLINYLLSLGVKQFDTDTALNNVIAQKYYQKNGFIKLGITRSYCKNR